MEATRTRRRITALAAVCASIALAGSARAEMFVDLYGGYAHTAASDTTSTGAGGFAPHVDSGTVGLRGGYWLESLPWLGIAGDFSWFSPDSSLSLLGSSADVDVYPLSALLMLRAPLLTSDAFPNGRLQPYGGVGPGIFFSDYYESLFVTDQNFEDTAVDVGVDVRAGARVMVLDWLGLFVEYRYTWFEPAWEDRIEGARTRIRTEYGTHHLVGGVGFHF